MLLFFFDIKELRGNVYRNKNEGFGPDLCGSRETGQQVAREVSISRQLPAAINTAESVRLIVL